MANQPNVFNTLINPIMVQEYERYLPTAFDEGMTLLEKMNKIILHLNRIGKLSNDVLSQWNQVMDWVMSDGLDASIDAKIDSMLADGTLAIIIGNAITNLQSEMGDLTTLNTSAKDTIVHAINELLSDINTFENTVNASNTANQNALNSTLSNIQYYGTPEQYGAKGDGVTDDSLAIQACLNANVVTAFKPKTYLITQGLVLPKNHSIEGNHACLKVGATWTNPAPSTNQPNNTVLYIQPRDPIWQSEFDMMSGFVKDLRLIGNSTLTLDAMFLGNVSKSTVTQSSTVNYCVFGMEFINISIAVFNNGLNIAEAWSNSFHNVRTSAITGTACYMVGQCVNNTFTACQFGTQGQGAYGLYMNGATYNGNFLRPEGNGFIGGFIGEANVGIRIISALATKFNSVIVDLNTTNAVTGLSMDDVTFTDCYLYSNQVVFALADQTTQANGTRVTFTNCNMAGNSDTASIGANQNGILFNGCAVINKITFWDSSRGTVVNCDWNVGDPTTGLIVVPSTATVLKANNKVKTTGVAVN